MKYACATTIPVKLTQPGRNYFPLVQKLDGKKIYSITQVNCIPFDGDTPVDPQYISSLTVNLTKDGRYYPVKDMGLDRIMLEYTRGVNLTLDCILSTQDCYLFVPDAVFPDVQDQVVTLLVWYEQEGYSRVCDENSWRYKSFEVNITSGRYRNYFPDDRTLNGCAFSRLFCATPKTGVTPSNQPTIPYSDVDYLRVTLVRGSYEVWDRVPLIVLLQDEWYRHLHLNNIVFDFQSSYIEAVDTSAAVTGGSLAINVKFQ